ncbi:TRAP transporter small permease [Skermanella mucosa]|uniref:TRAP transporter small permease n=1 Tax=Skermanella mucosa TaxID=1789672 RepID=UPI00192B22BC|nr:TRAP transporter small permease [Skermanella mucosa]UEM21663.1 TRAP transporter small permease [Skermanella mucosa]
MKPALAAYSRLLDVLSRLALWIGGFGLVAMTAAIAWQVWGRFVVGDTPSWTEPVSLFLMLWFILLVAAVGVRERFHLGLDLIRDTVPEPVRVAMDLFSFVIVGLFGGAMAWYGLELVLGTWSAIVPVLGIPEGMNYLALVVSGVLIVLFSIERALILLVERKAMGAAESLARAHAPGAAMPTAD